MLTTSATVSAPRVSAQAYLEAERRSQDRNEFLHGEIIPMGGASRIHNLITHNLSRLVGNAVAELAYETYQSDMRVYNPLSSSYCYPDVVVVAGTPQFVDNDFDNLLNPVLVIEVLSPGTGAYDRGDKAFVYRHIPSLHEYLIVSQTEALVEHWVRLEENKWQIEEIKGLDQTLRLLGGLCEIKTADVYRKVFPAQQSPG